MPYTPVGDIASGASHRLDPRRRAIVVLKAYFDDSGTHDQSKAVVWAGFMATSDEWALFEPPWAALRDREGLTRFHAADFQNGEGECKNPLEWPAARREAVRADFRAIIASRKVIGLGAVVRADDWYALSDPALISRFGDPINLALEHCIQLALHWACAAAVQQTGRVEKVQFFFDLREPKMTEARIRDIGKRYESEWFEGLSFVQMRNILPLQAADMLAYETYRLETSRIKGSGTEPPLGAHLNAMLRGVPIYGQYYDEAALRRLAAQCPADGHYDLLAPQGASPELSS
jgi:Protein of unknown function (DUF3800)